MEKYDLKYLYYNIKSFSIESLGYNRHFKLLKNKEIIYRTLSEQKQIVRMLDKINDTIVKNQNEINNLIELKNSYFFNALSDSINCLGDFIEEYKCDSCGNQELPILSVTKDAGVVFQNEKFKKRIASTDVSKYKVIPYGIVVQGIHIDEKNFGLQNLVEKGIVSSAYRAWKVNTLAIPELLVYFLRSDIALKYIKSKLSGTIKRREKLSDQDFLSMPINLPSYEKQEKILTIMVKIDNIIQKLKYENELLKNLFDKKMDEYFK